MPTSPTPLTLASTQALALARRWSRVGLGVRCAYNPGQPAVIRHYVALGTRLARTQAVPAPEVFRRMASVLLGTAADPALPWQWRSLCLEHSAWPVARLTTLLRRAEPDAIEALHARWRDAQEGLSAGPGGSGA